MKILSLLFLVVMVVCATAASAEEIDCANAITQTDMNICAFGAYDKAEAEMNAVYQKALEHFSDKDTATQFEESQKAWLNYRDLHCDYAADQYKGGSIRPLIYATCMETLTKERTWHIVNLFPEWK